MSTSSASQPRIARPRFRPESLQGPEILSELIHKLGHEIGNPLTAVISLSAIIERFGGEMASSQLAGTAAKLGGYGHSIGAEAWKVSALTERLVMLLSRRPASLSRVDLSDLCDRAVKRVRSRFGYSTAELISNVSLSERIFVHSDQEQLLILFSEILVNAFQMSEREVNGVSAVKSAPVSLFLRTTGDHALVLVRNDLAEPCALELETLFEPMVTTLGESKHIGIGLTVCATIAERCGAGIRILEEPREGGVTFIVEVTLPLQSAE